MRYVIYRDKKDNRITNFHACTDDITEKKVELFNDTGKSPTWAEIIEVEENSFTDYLIKFKARQLEDYIEDLRDLQQSIEDISSNIENRLWDVETEVKLLKEKDMYASN